ncbi:MAG: sugar transferase [Paracoccus sp.]|uniref:sugar transferase n=2 Tax=Paracoccus TaxID=265 RepID=UPI000C6202AA|nr:sugar transferase [uncultured Paracoccus sp.]MAN56429.1 sugar transferase [Paracoccus sp. (in: a-proteobacteria)]MAN57258.1 sugar transferase [Paracoccus sp. (in: a-proteobacteria)]|tara:strand:+ start:1608 stop:2279 length:672 start_codon:yes stop_codon:yes gene_type:complete
MAVEEQMVAVVPAPVNLSKSVPWVYRSMFKRPLDVLIVLLTSPVILPVVIVLAILVMLDGGKPFYSQERVGRDGRRYRMWKLRSMVVDADQRLADHLASDDKARSEWDLSQKLRDDPRVTRTGRLLRKCSMDELPQLWNVLRGDMSLVGPRPMLPEQQVMYEGEAYYRLRPGITGFWQTSERNRCSFSSRAFYDDRYERSVSLTTDVTLLWRTVLVVMRATGC